MHTTRSCHVVYLVVRRIGAINSGVVTVGANMRKRVIVEFCAEEKALVAAGARELSFGGVMIDHVLLQTL